jgi:hypothetical protein
MQSIPKMTPTFKKIVRRLLKDDKFYTALIKNAKGTIGYDAKFMTANELNFLKNIGKTDAKNKFIILKNLIETTRPPKPPNWI